MKRTHLLLATLALNILTSAGTTHAAGTPLQDCASRRIKAASKYSACQAKAVGKFETSSRKLPRYAHHLKLDDSAVLGRGRYWAGGMPPSPSCGRLSL